MRIANSLVLRKSGAMKGHVRTFLTSESFMALSGMDKPIHVDRRSHALIVYEGYTKLARKSRICTNSV